MVAAAPDGGHIRVAIQLHETIAGAAAPTPRTTTNALALLSVRDDGAMGLGGVLRHAAAASAPKTMTE
jgi:hypothetical protein